MRTHSQIVRDYGAAAMRADLERCGVKVQGTTTQRWADRDSIPGPFWAPLVTLGAATLEELANAAATRKTEAA